MLEAIDEASTRYIDEVEIQAGWKTPLVCLCTTSAFTHIGSESDTSYCKNKAEDTTMTIESMLALDKSDLQAVAQTALHAEDIPQLVDLLSAKDDEIRYRAFLLLQGRAAATSDVYPYWQIFQDKLKSENSYQRSLGLMLMAENAKWDAANKLDAALDDYLALMQDEKPITVRQCIQSLGKIVPHKPQLSETIATALMALDLMAIKETMRKSVLLDILHALLVIRQSFRSDEIESYIQRALSGGILDKKAIKQIEALF